VPQEHSARDEFFVVGVGERPTDGVSTASDSERVSQNVVDVQKSSWADVVASRDTQEDARVKMGGKENHRSRFTFLKQSR
jgi:hypothetical protein